jgi:hypothetical protein
MTDSCASIAAPAAVEFSPAFQGRVSIVSKTAASRRRRLNRPASFNRR